MTFAYLLLAHLLYDFHWQGDFIAQNKGKYPFLLMVHALTWAMLLTAVLIYFGEFALWKPVFLFVTHFFCDGWKARQPKTPDKFWLLYVDQAIHLATMLMVVALD